VVVRSSNGAEGTSWSQVYSRNFLIAVGGGVIRDAGGVGGTNRMAYSYDGGLSWTTNNTPVLTSAAQNSVGSIRTVKYGNGMWVAGGDSQGSGSSGGNCLAWSRDGVNWTGAGGTQIFGSAGACYAVCCNDRGRWVAVGGGALYSAGTYTNNSGAIYTMAWSDDGMNWTPVLGSRALFGIVCQGVSYGADASGVGMWTAIGRGGTYTGCAYSYDAKTWYLSQTSGSLFGTSANVLTERYAPVASGNWMSVSVSSTGQYQSATVNGGNIWTSSDFGISWTSRIALTGEFSISISSTGQYQSVALLSGGNIRTSSDYGVTWTAQTTPGSTFIRSISLSSSGQYQSAPLEGGNMLTSSDYGVTWIQRTNPGNRNWISVSLSSTGQYQTGVVYGGNIWTSSDYGVNWTERTTGNPAATRNWRSVSLSSTGQYQTAVVYGGNIWTSSDYGVSWTQDVGGVQNWFSVSVSSTGRYQTAVVNGGRIYTSSNYGVNWSLPRDSVRDWYSVSISSSGQYQTAVVYSGAIYISSNFGETWSASANDSRSLSVVYGKDASGVGMWVATAGRRDRDVAASVANTMAYSYDGKLWRGIRASACLSEQAWSVAYGKDGFGVGMWVAAGYDAVCGLKWSYDGVTWNASTGASGAAVWASAAAGRRALCVYWNGSMWLASTSDTRNGEPRGSSTSGVPGYLLYSYNGKNWLPVLSSSTYAINSSVYSVLPNPVILDFGSFYDDQGQRGATIANTTAGRAVGAVMSGGVPIENISTIVPYGRGSVVTGQIPFLLGGDSGLGDTIITAATTRKRWTFIKLQDGDGFLNFYPIPANNNISLHFNIRFETNRTVISYNINGLWAPLGGGSDSVFDIHNLPNPSIIYISFDVINGWKIEYTVSGVAKVITVENYLGITSIYNINDTYDSDYGTKATITGPEIISSSYILPPITSELAATTTSLSTSVDGGMTWRAVPNSTKVMTKVNKILCDETTQQIVAVGTGNYSVATSTPSKAADADGWTGVFGSRMTDTQTGLFERFGTGAAWFAGAKMWIASGRAQSRRGSSLAVSVNGTVWQDAKIVSQVAAGSAGVGRGGGLASRTTTSSNAYDNFIPGPTAQSTNNNWQYFEVNQDRTGAVLLTNWRPNGNGVISSYGQWDNDRTGQCPFIQKVTGSGTITAVGGLSFTGPALVLHPDDSNANNIGLGYKNITTNTLNISIEINLSLLFPSSNNDGINYHIQRALVNSPRYILYTSGSILNGSTAIHRFNNTIELQSGEIVYLILNRRANYFYDHTRVEFNVNVISMTTIVPYTSAATPLLTYTDSASAFSTQVGGIAVNSQYNRAVVGGSGVQFVAGGRGGLAVSNDGQTWVAGGASASAVFQTPTNATTRTGSGGFDASFGTVALTQRLTTPTTYPSGTFNGIVVNETGQYQTAVIYNGALLTSSDYGVNWTQRDQTRAWTRLSMSSSGQYQTAVVNPGLLYTSSDFGTTWTSRTSANSGVNTNWNGVSVSSTGQYQTAVIDNGVIHTSSDYGVNWATRASTATWNHVSLSSTGQYQTAVVRAGFVSASSDYGVSWATRDMSRNWVAVSISSTGQYQTALVGSGSVYTSFNFGTTWTARLTDAGRNWTYTGISLSSTGQYQTAIVFSTTTFGYIYTSSDYGVNWTARMTDGHRQWGSISVSGSGQYQSAAVAGGTIYTSYDFGVTWVNRSTATRTNAFTRVRSSASGQYQIATSGPVGSTIGQLYVSSDYGQSWMPRRGLGSWLGGAVSASGAVMTMTANIRNEILTAPVFNNANDRITLGNKTAWNSILSNLTVECWFRTLDTGNQEQYSTLVSRWVSSDVANSHFRLAMDNLINNKIIFAVLTNTGQSVTVNTLLSYNDAKWYHVAGTYSSTTKTSSLYINGVLIASTTNSNAGPQLTNISIPLLIGTDAAYVPTIDREFRGAISDVRIWNVARSASEIASNYQIQLIGNEPGLAGYWKLDQPNAIGYPGTITAFRDSTANANHSENHSFTSWTENTLLSYSILLLRSTDYGATFSNVSGTTLTESAYWQSIAMTNSGAVQTALVYGGAIYRSLDTGVTWSNTGITIDGSTSANTGTPRNWQDIAVSAETGAVQVTCVSGGYLYVSTNTGATWVSSSVVIDGAGTQTTNRAWRAVAVSANGQYGLACVNSTSASGFLYRSVNSGTSWESSSVAIDGVGTQTSNRTWQDVGMSANGKYQVACLNSNNQTSQTSNIISTVSIMVMPAGSLTPTLGTSWTQRGADIDGEAVGDQSGYSVSLSADGTVVAVGAPMNFGANGRESGQVRVYALNGANAWIQRGADIDGAAGLSSLPMVVTATTTNLVKEFNWCAMSGTGQYQSAVVSGNSEYIYTSDNYGVSWTQRTNFNGVFQRISLSSSGQYQSAVIYQSGGSGQYIFTSSDYGVSWTKRTQFTGLWTSISLSSTGQYQSATISSGGDGAYIYTSSDYGVSWTKRTQFTGNWQSISLSSTGQYQSATMYSDKIYISSDYGVTWQSSSSATDYWLTVSLSSTGQYQSAASQPGYIYTSNNFGVSWTPRTQYTKEWRCISLSSTGQYQSAVSRNNNIEYIYTSSDFGVTWTQRTQYQKRWWSIAVSSSGQYQTAVSNNTDFIYFSRDYGFTWSEYASYEITEGDRFGTSVSLSANGNTVAVGSPYYDLSGIINRGQVRVFDWSGSAWSVRGTNILLGEGTNDYSGMSVSLSKDGNVVAIGAPLNDGAAGTDSGHIRVYAWNGSAWVQRGADIDGAYGMTSTNRVVTAVGTSETMFWRSISLSSTGQYQTAMPQGNRIRTSSDFGVTWTERTVPPLAWWSVSLSSTGQYQTAVIYSGRIWTSFDFGVTWTERTSPVSQIWHSISLSSTGQYQTAVAESGRIWTSFDFGVTWTERTSVNQQWRSISLSSTGQHQTAVVTNGRIWTSSDFGVTWTERASSEIRNWYSVSLSSTGQYQTAVVYTGRISTSFDFGVTWTERTSVSQLWYSISLSSTGQYQSAVAGESGNIWTSSDFGVTWTPRAAPGSRNWYSVSLSSTGQYQRAVVTNGIIYFSRDYGFTWSEYASYEITDGDQSGSSVSLSADGSVVAVGSPYTDTTTGINSGHMRVFSWNGSAWTQRGNAIIGESVGNQSGWSASMSADGTTVAIGAPYNNGVNGIGSGQVRVYKWNGTTWGTVGTVDIDGEAGALTPPRVVSATTTRTSSTDSGITVSSTGQYQSMVVTNGGRIYISSNYGVNWREVESSRIWRYISMSSSGQYQTATVSSGVDNKIYISNNFGNTWTAKENSRAWVGVSLSSTGQYQTALVEGGQIYISSNYGNNWSAVDSSRNWTKVSLSSTGQYQSAVVWGGGIYTSSNYGANWQLVPSTNGAPININWNGIALSSTGQYQSACSTGNNIYVSSNFGVNWTSVSASNGAPNGVNWYDISVSSSGQYQTATYVGNAIYVSSNFGVNWTVKTIIAGATAMSSTGQYQTSVRSDNLMYFSRDYGFTWSTTASYEVVTGGDQSGYSISLSADGNSLAVGAPYNDAGVTGADRGHVRVYHWNGSTTWVQRSVDLDGEASDDLAGWSVTMSADGSTVAFGAPMNDGAGNLLLNSGSVRVFNTSVTNAITYTSSNSSVADICGNLLIIKGTNGTTNIVATQGATTTNGTLTVSGSTYTLVYTTGSLSSVSFIYYSKNYGASWTSLTAAGSRAWSSVSISENGSTISATTNDTGGGVWTYAMPDEQYYRPATLANVVGGGSTVAATIRAVAYGNSGTGSAVDGYWVAGGDASGNTLAYSSNGVDWTAVVGSKTALFNAVNGVAYGVDALGAPIWVAVGAPFVGSVPGATAYSIAYSYNMTTWVGVRNAANFTGQGNHVAFGQDEYGAGVWVAVGQGDGVLAANLGDSTFGNSNGNTGATIFYSYDGANWAAGQGAGVFSTSGTDVTWGVDASGVATWVATGVGFTDPVTGVFTAGGQVAHSVNGRVWTPISITPVPFTGDAGAAALTVAYGRAGSQGSGAPLWIVGGSGGTNVFARSSRPSAVTAGTWTVTASNAGAGAAPFPVCNSLGYSNGVWVAGNNTNATNILARSVDGGATWTAITASSMSGIFAGATAMGANAFCNYSLAVADFSNDTNLRSWVAVQGTKNFFFEGGVSAVATVTPDISAAVYGGGGGSSGRAWWVAGGVGLTGVASLGYTTDPSGATGWTKAASADIANLASINAVAFSPFTQRWLAVGAGATGSPGTNLLVSDASGVTWTSTTLATAATPVITLHTCVWNQLPTPTTVSNAGRWLVGGTRNDGGVNNVDVSNSASVYISTDVSGIATPWTPVAGTGAILSQVYSLAYNGRVWIAAGVRATDGGGGGGGSTSTLMRTTDPTGASGWVGITATNTSVDGFDTAARSITWNPADGGMWIATGENTATTGSSMIYSLDISGGAGTWRSVQEANSICFSGEGTGIAYTGDRWFAVGDGNRAIVATTGANAAVASAATWTPVSHGTSMTRATDIAYTGRRLIATGSGAGSTTGVILSTDNTGASWSAGPSTGFSDVLGGGTSIAFEASYDGVGRIIATGRSATNVLSVSADGGSTWSTSSTQFSSTNTVETTTQPLFTTGANSVAYVGNDTLFGIGGNDVHWTGKRWVAVGRNTADISGGGGGGGGVTVTTVGAAGAPGAALPIPEIINNNTTPLATSDDGITWQCVRPSQAPNLSEGVFVATNSRIGSTPLIDSQILIADGGDTEQNTDYGGMVGGVGGFGTGICGIDIIAEITPVSHAAHSIGAVGIIGAAGNGGANSVGNASTASFDTTAFTITPRPLPRVN
jgi:hypothetical protein